MRTSRLRLKSMFSKKNCYLYRINNKKYYSVECLLPLELGSNSLARHGRLHFLKIGYRSIHRHYSSTMLFIFMNRNALVYQESTVIMCAKNWTCNPRSSNVQARVTSCVRQPATARKWREVMQMPLGVYSWDPRNHVSQKRAHWRHLANMIAYTTWCPDVITE